MNDANGGGSPVDPIGEPDDAVHDEFRDSWRDLQRALAIHLGTMVDPEEGDHLVIELPGPSTSDGCAPYVQFAGLVSGMIRAEVAGNCHLTPQHQLGEDGCDYLTQHGWRGNHESEANWYVERRLVDAPGIAEEVVTVLREHFALAHAGLLIYHAWGPAAGGAAALGLCEADDLPVEAPEQRPLAVEPNDRGELLQLVSEVLRRRLGSDPEVDEDGDLVLEHDGVPVWVRVCGDQPAVQIMARVADGVRSCRASVVEVSILNRDHRWVRWSVRQRTVWQTLVLPAQPFVPIHLDQMLEVFCDTMTTTRDDLILRTGAEVDPGDIA